MLAPSFLNFLLTMLQIMTRTHLHINERIPIRPHLRERDRVRLDRARSALFARIPRRHRPGDFYHGRRDVEGAVPFPLRAGVARAVRGALGGAEGDTGCETGADDFTELEADVEADVDGYADGIGC